MRCEKKKGGRTGPVKTRRHSTAIEQVIRSSLLLRTQAGSALSRACEVQPAAAAAAAEPNKIFPASALLSSRRRPSFRPQRLGRMRPHRAPRQELCSEGQISKTDEATSRRQCGPRNNKRGDPGRTVHKYRSTVRVSPTIIMHFLFRFPFLLFIHKPGMVEVQVPVAIH